LRSLAQLPGDRTRPSDPTPMAEQQGLDYRNRKAPFDFGVLREIGDAAATQTGRLDQTAGWLQDARHPLHQRAFPRSIGTDDRSQRTAGELTGQAMNRRMAVIGQGDILENDRATRRAAHDNAQ
jgi:hypothetical protein